MHVQTRSLCPFLGKLLNQHYSGFLKFNKLLWEAPSLVQGSLGNPSVPACSPQPPSHSIPLDWRPEALLYRPGGHGHGNCRLLPRHRPQRDQQSLPDEVSAEFHPLKYPQRVRRQQGMLKWFPVIICPILPPATYSTSSPLSCSWHLLVCFSIIHLSQPSCADPCSHSKGILDKSVFPSQFLRINQYLCVRSLRLGH